MKQRMVTRTTLVLDGNVFTTTDPQQAAELDAVLGRSPSPAPSGSCWSARRGPDAIEEEAQGSWPRPATDAAYWQEKYEYMKYMTGWC